MSLPAYRTSQLKARPIQVRNLIVGACRIVEATDLTVALRAARNLNQLELQQGRLTLSYGNRSLFYDYVILEPVLHIPLLSNN